ncbi:MAG: hypothetical protein J6Y53_04910 [Alphaproteobacteria bacterium]|nr:hypothetical protein [Alphaproteobacteria bacterium]
MQKKKTDKTADKTAEKKLDKKAKLQAICHRYRNRIMFDAAQRNAVMKGLKNIDPDIENEDLVKLSYDVVLLPTDKEVTVKDQEIKVADLQFMLAESIENLCSGTDSRQEYYSWFGECDNIITRMNDGYVSDADLEIRNTWISDSYVREAEIMTCLALYQSSSYPLARERHNLLYNKLVKLRQLRSAIQNATIAVSDEQEEKEQKMKQLRQRAMASTAAITLIAQNDIMWNLSKEELIGLGMYHGNDFDLFPEYEYFYPSLTPHKKVNALPPKSQVFDDVPALSPAENISLPEHTEAIALPETTSGLSALPAHENFALNSASSGLLALPPHEQYDFASDLRYNFMQCMNKQFFEKQSYAEELLLTQSCESRSDVESRISTLRGRCKNCTFNHPKFFEAAKYRAFCLKDNRM